MPRYNFALIPTQYNSKFIFLASKLSHQIKEIGQYQLNKSSVSHVTLCQFDAKENEIEDLWRKFQKLNQPQSMMLTFGILRSNLSHACNWYSLIPNEIKDLHIMHQNTLTIIKNPINFHGNEYDPHLTLLNSHDLQNSNHISKLDTPLKDNFTIAIIDRNEVGQAFKIIKN